jgi:hypothetical protein
MRRVMERREPTQPSRARLGDGTDDSSARMQLTIAGRLDRQSSAAQAVRKRQVIDEACWCDRPVHGNL